MLSHWNNFKVVNSYSIYTSTIRIRPFTTQQLVSLQPKEMAKKIRLALQDTDREACSDWMKTHTFANFQNTWYKLHYDHLAYGGQQIVDFFERTDKFILNVVYYSTIRRRKSNILMAPTIILND
eukprot:397316_1